MRRSVEQKVRDQLHETGQRGVRQLARIFDVEDYDGLGKELSFDEMRNKLRACQVELTHNEFKVLYGWCDKNQDGMVTVGHFIAGQESNTFVIMSHSLIFSSPPALKYMCASEAVM